MSGVRKLYTVSLFAVCFAAIAAPSSSILAQTTPPATPSEAASRAEASMAADPHQMGKHMHDMGKHMELMGKKMQEKGAQMEKKGDAADVETGQMGMEMGKMGMEMGEMGMEMMGMEMKDKDAMPDGDTPHD